MLGKSSVVSSVVSLVRFCVAFSFSRHNTDAQKHRVNATSCCVHVTYECDSGSGESWFEPRRGNGSGGRKPAALHSPSCLVPSLALRGRAQEGK